jgi:hypothetical protein
MEKRISPLQVAVFEIGDEFVLARDFTSGAVDYLANTSARTQKPI